MVRRRSKKGRFKAYPIDPSAIRELQAEAAMVRRQNAEPEPRVVTLKLGKGMREIPMGPTSMAEAPLHNPAPNDDYRLLPDDIAAEIRARRLAEQGVYARPLNVKGDVHPHSDPYHHVGTCDAACRAGHSLHFHRRATAEER